MFRFGLIRPLVFIQKVVKNRFPLLVGTWKHDLRILNNFIFPQNITSPFSSTSLLYRSTYTNGHMDCIGRERSNYNRKKII